VQQLIFESVATRVIILVNKNYFLLLSLQLRFLNLISYKVLLDCRLRV
jgi:hypothetical protein